MLKSVWKHFLGRPVNSFQKNLHRKPFHSPSSSTSNCKAEHKFGERLGIEPIAVNIVNALHLGERDNAFALLYDSCNGNGTLRTEDFAYILEYCAESPDPQFALQTWSVMLGKEIYISQRCYSFRIQSLCKGGYLKEALEDIRLYINDRDGYCMMPIFNKFLHECSKHDGLAFAEQCLALMGQFAVGKNEVTYSEVLKLAVLKRNLAEVHDLWKEYIHNYSPSNHLLGNFIKSFSLLGDVNSAYELLQQMVDSAFRGSVDAIGAVQGKTHTSNLCIPVPSYSPVSLERYGVEENDQFSSMDCENLDMQMSGSLKSTDSTVTSSLITVAGIYAPDALKSMGVLKLLKCSFNDIIHACAKAKDGKLAEKLFIQMQDLGLVPSGYTYDGLIKAVVVERGIKYAMDILREMQDRGFKPHASTLGVLATRCCRAFELDMAEALLNQIDEHQSVHPFNSFIEACNILDLPERAIPMLSKMKKSRVQFDTRTYEMLFSLFGNVNMPYEKGDMLSRNDVAKRINAIEESRIKSGVQHTVLSMRNLLRALGTEGMMWKQEEYLLRAEHQSSRGINFLGTILYNTVLHSLVKAEETSKVIQIFGRMTSYGFSPDVYTYNIMANLCVHMGCYKSACALVSLLIRDGYCPCSVTYTTLIQILMLYGDFGEALRLLDLTSSADALQYNTILIRAGQKGKIDIVEVLLEKMHREKIQPDPCTCRVVYTAYARLGLHATAVEALQVLSMRMISEDDDNLQERRKEFEDLIMSEDLEAVSLILQQFQKSHGYLEAALLNLRWCAILGFSISWFPNQSPWAKRLSDSYSGSGTASNTREILSSKYKFRFTND